MKMSPEYLAGVIDSDGSISVVLKHKNRPNPSYTISIQLTWSDTEKSRKVLNLLKETYGGSVFESKSLKSRYPNSRPVIKYSVACQKSRKLLEDILPYLLLKKDQAVLALDILNTTGYGIYGFGRPKPKDLIEKHRNIYLQMKELNTKNSGVRLIYDNQ